MNNNVHTETPQVGAPAPAVIRPARLQGLRRLSTVMMRLVLLLLFLLGFFLSIFPWGRAVLRSTFFLPAIISASQPAPLIWGGEPIQHTQTTLPSSTGTINLDIYAPSSPEPLVSRVRSGALVISGVGDNRQEPQLVNLLEALARTGVVAMNLTTPTLSNYDLSVADGDSAVRAFQTLAALPALAGKPVGIISISAGVTLACLAAADPRIRQTISYVAAFGGYFDIKSLLRTIGQRSQVLDGVSQPWHPIDIPLQVLANVAADNLPPDDGTTLINAFANGGTPLSSADLAHLSPGAQAVYRLLAGTDPDSVDADLAELPPDLQTQLTLLSPSHVVAQIRAPIYLLHDAADDSLPVSQSRAFDAALNRLHHPHEYVELHIFDHVRVRQDNALGPLVTDGSHLFVMLNDLLARGS